MEHAGLNGMIPKWDACVSISSSHGLGTYAGEEAERGQESGVVDDSKETSSSRCNRADACMNSQRCQHAQDLYKLSQAKLHH